MGNLRTFQTTGNWSDDTKWADSTPPGEGDAVVIADGVVCTINTDTPALASVVVGETTWPSIGTNGDAGTGRCVVSSGVTVTFDTMNAGAVSSSYGFFYFAGGEGASYTLDGSVSGGSVASAYGCRNDGAGTINITTCTGGGVANAYGCRNDGVGTINITTCTGGGVANAYGCLNNGAGTINITTCTGGGVAYAYGCLNNVAGTINITTCTGGSASGAHGCRNDGVGTINITTCTGGGVANAYGCLNNGAGTINITTCTGGGAVSAYGCYLYNNDSPTGRCYITGSVKSGFDGTNPVNGLNNRVTNAGYHFLAYGAKLYDRFGNEETSSYTAINSIAGVGYGWLITAEINSAADLEAINNLVGDANVSFVQTADITVTTPPSIGTPEMPFEGEFTGHDSVKQQQYKITNAITEPGEIFNFNDGTIERLHIVADIEGVSEEHSIALCSYNNGTIQNCFLTGTMTGEGAFLYGLCYENSGLLLNCYSTVPNVNLLGGNNGGTSTSCYQLSDVTGEAVHQLTVEEMKTKSSFVNWDFDTIWAINSYNNGFPWLIGDIRYYFDPDFIEELITQRNSFDNGQNYLQGNKILTIPVTSNKNSQAFLISLS